jgi:DNA-binding CsgD family transcriptional regulator
MFSNSDLITQIHAIIHSNPVEEKQLDIDLAAIERSLNHTKDSPKQDYYPFLDKSDMKRMDDRMDVLEEQNKKLQFIVQFLLVRLARSLSGQNDTTTEKQNGHAASIENDSLLSAKDKKPVLTKRETEVFKLLAKGLCAKEIAKMLFISETTVITHKKNLKDKFHAKNTVELIANILGE